MNITCKFKIMCQARYVFKMWINYSITGKGIAFVNEERSE